MLKIDQHEQSTQTFVFEVKETETFHKRIEVSATDPDTARSDLIRLLEEQPLSNQKESNPELFQEIGLISSDSDVLST